MRVLFWGKKWKQSLVCTKVDQWWGFSKASLNLCAERVNLRVEVKWPQATSLPVGRALAGSGACSPGNFEIWCCKNGHFKQFSCLVQVIYPLHQTSVKIDLILMICLKHSRKTNILMTLDKCDEPLKKPEAVGVCAMMWVWAKPRYLNYRKRGSAWSGRERERERERERDVSDVTIVALKLAMSLHFPLPKIRTWRWVYTFPCQKFALFVSSFTLPISPFLNGHHLWRWNSQWVLTFRRQKFSPSLFWLPRLARLFFPSKKWIKLIPKTIGNRKRDCAWGCARGINTTRKNLQIANHKSGRRSFRSPDWFVLCDLPIFSGVVYPPSATSRTISFSISNSFWYYLHCACRSCASFQRTAQHWLKASWMAVICAWRNFPLGFRGSSFFFFLLRSRNSNMRLMMIVLSLNFQHVLPGRKSYL